MFAQNVVFFLSVGMHLHFFSVFWATKNMALPRKSDESSQVFSKFWLSFAMVRTSRLAANEKTVGPQDFILHSWCVSLINPSGSRRTSQADSNSKHSFLSFR
jgi:hypothetical protein